MRATRKTSLLLAASIALSVLTAADRGATQVPAPAQDGEIARLKSELERLTDGGLDDEARPVAQRLLELQERALGPEHVELAATLEALAEIEKSGGVVDERCAERVFREAERQQDISRAAEFERELRRCEHRPRNVELRRRAIGVLEKAYGPDDARVAEAISPLVTELRWAGRDAEAEPLLLRALSIHEKALGPDANEVELALDDLVHLYLDLGNYPAAVRMRARQSATDKRGLHLVFEVGNESLKARAMELLRDDTDEVISLHTQAAPGSPEAARFALETLLRRKGRVLDAMAEAIGALRESATPEDVELLRNIEARRDALAALVVRGAGGGDAEAHRERVAAAAQELDGVELKAASRSARILAQRPEVKLEDVQAAIPAGSVLVELTRYRPYRYEVRSVKARRDGRALTGDSWGAPRYAAYVLHQRGAPAYADLGDAAEIDALVQRLRAALDLPTDDARTPARALFGRVMRPVQALLGDTRSVLLSPDAALNLVPFAALVGEDGRYLVERFSFTYLTAGRELVRAHVMAPRSGPVLVGYPDYGPLGGVAAGVAGGRRGRRAAGMESVRFPPLPGTRREVEEIAAILPGSRTLARGDATEAAVKALHGPQVLHIATHGFFLPGPEGSAGRSAADERPAFENPLLRAGLALAGANPRRSDPDDGVLTALEVTALDLRGTKLVTLSACETGVGEASSGEGVYGLRRALRLSGAETQVISLWRLEDEATSALMSGYYRRLAAGGGRSEALREQQLAMLADPNTAHPFYWSSFIVSGEAGALDGRPVAPRFGQVAPSARGCACGAATAMDDGARWSWLWLALAVAVARRAQSEVTRKVHHPR